MWKYFKLSEFACPCCEQHPMDTRLIDLLDSARQVAGVAFKITSGYRCVKHNTAIGGGAKSTHTLGLAADIACADSVSRHAILKALFQVGFQRIEVANRHIHVDIAETAIGFPSVCWLGVSK